MERRRIADNAARVVREGGHLSSSWMSAFISNRQGKVSTGTAGLGVGCRWKGVC
jgi:hypothetical protein